MQPVQTEREPKNRWINVAISRASPALQAAKRLRSRCSGHRRLYDRCSGHPTITGRQRMANAGKFSQPRAARQHSSGFVSKARLNRAAVSKLFPDCEDNEARLAQAGQERDAR